MRLLVVLLLALFTACDSSDPEKTTDTETESSLTESETTDSEAPVGATGLEGYCERYKECGGSYYETAEDCVDATYGYWGDCPAMEAALDVFGDCMMTIDCDDYNPDSYNPANTACAEEWDDVGSTSC